MSLSEELSYGGGGLASTPFLYLMRSSRCCSTCWTRGPYPRLGQYKHLARVAIGPLRRVDQIRLLRIFLEISFSRRFNVATSPFLEDWACKQVRRLAKAHGHELAAVICTSGYFGVNRYPPSRKWAHTYIPQLEARSGCDCWPMLPMKGIPEIELVLN